MDKITLLYETIKNFLNNCINVSIFLIIVTGVCILFSVILLFSHPLNTILIMCFKLFSPILMLLLFKFLLTKFNKKPIYILINTITIIYTISCIYINWHNYIAYSLFVNYKYLTPKQHEIVINELKNFQNGQNVVKLPQKNH